MTNARTSREATAQKAARMRAEVAAKERRRRIGIIAGATVVMLAVAGGIAAFVVSQNKSSTAAASLAAVKTYKVGSRNHVDGTVHYAQNPPVGGDHNKIWLNCGIYTSPVANENAVHDLEHGAVWITYRPDLAKADIAKLTGVVKGQTYVDLTPYPGLPAPVVASAWGVQLYLTGASDRRLEAFIKKYKQGPQTPEGGSPCTGGTGTPNG